MPFGRTLASLVLAALVGACAPGAAPTSPALPSSMSPSASALLGCPPADQPAQSATSAAPTIKFQPNVQVGGPDPGAVAGTFRLCLGAPYSREVTGAATCTWSQFRTEVVSVVGKAVAAGDESVAPALEVREPAPGRFVLVRDQGESGLYEVGLSSTVQMDSAPSRQSGNARFGALQLTKAPGTNREPTGPRALDASMSWICAPAPATEPGFGAGSIVLRIDKPISQEFRTRAACSWVASERRTWVRLVDSYQFRGRIDDKRYIGIEFPDPPTSVFRDATLVVHLTNEDFSSIGEYGHDPGRIFVLRTAGDGRAGRLRFLDLRVPEQVENPRPGALPELSGVLDWTCAAPSGPIPRVATDQEPGPLGERAGTFELLVDAPAAQRGGPARCLVNDDANGSILTGLHSELALGGERVTLIAQADGTTAGLFRESGDGRYLGEYLNPPGDMNLTQVTDDGRGKSRLNLPFNATDPAFAPLGGPGGPNEIDADLTWDCSAP